MLDNKLRFLIALSVGLVVAVIYFFLYGINSASFNNWFIASATKITLGDILIFVIIHAILNRSEIKK